MSEPVVSSSDLPVERRPGAWSGAWTRLSALGIAALAIVAPELLAGRGDSVAAAAGEGIVLVGLLGAYVWSSGDGRAFAALALVPLLRLSSLALSVQDPIGALLLAGTPALLAVVLAADALGVPGILRLWDIRLRSQWQVALAALFAAELATPLVGVTPLVVDPSLPRLAAAALVVFVFAGVLEELLFRGLIQGTLTPLLGGASVVVADGLFAATYLDSYSAGYALMMAAFGLACGAWVRHTGSVAGSAVAHGLFAAGVLVIWPVIL